MKAVGLRRTGAIFVTAAAFGVAVSVIKGNGGGVRAAIGNTSAPWLLLPFLAGASGRGRRLWEAALVGAAASWCALVGFYLANAFVLDLGPHPWLLDARLTLAAGSRYLELAVVTGPLFGAVGGWWRRHRSRLLATLVAALLVFEPLAWLVYERGRGAYTNHPVVWGVEVVLGVSACTVVGVVARSSPRERPIES